MKDTTKMNTNYNKEHKKILALQEKEYPVIRKVQQEILLQQDILNFTKTNLCETHKGDKICLTGIKSFGN